MRTTKGMNGQNFILSSHSNRCSMGFFLSAVNYYGEMPWTMLNFQESEANSALNDFFQIRGIPSLVLFSTDGTITIQGREAIMTTPFDEIRNFEELKRAAEAKAAEELQALRESFNPIGFFSGYLHDKEGSLVSTSSLENKIVGLYFRYEIHYFNSFSCSYF